MIFAGGVRFIRLRSPEVSGCASLSARAAASRALGVSAVETIHQLTLLVILSGGVVREANEAAVEGPDAAGPTEIRQGILTANSVRMPFHVIVPQSVFGPSTPQIPRFAENLLRSG